MSDMPETRHPRVAVVTPVFRDLPRTLQFLESLGRQVFRDFTAVIVDMGGDNAGEVVRREHPEAVVLKEEDILWSGGTNAGVRYAMERPYEYVFTVNNDVKLDEECLKKLVAFADGQPRSLIGAMVCDEENAENVWYFGGYFTWIGNMPHACGRVRDFPEPAQPQWLTGMGTLIPVQAYREVGLYDAERFPQYFADADFSLRARREGGYHLWVIPQARLYVDTRSSWLGRRLDNPHLKNVGELLFDRKSPMNLRARYDFYKRHLRRPRLKFFLFNVRYVPGVLRAFTLSLLRSSRREATERRNK